MHPLTADEIRSAVLDKARGRRITRQNYTELAEQVVPSSTFPITLAKQIATEHGLKDLITTRNIVLSWASTDDWLDVCCFAVANNQLRNVVAYIAKSSPKKLSKKEIKALLTRVKKMTRAESNQPVPKSPKQKRL